MINRMFILVFLSCTFCVGHSVLTTCVGRSDREAPGNTTRPTRSVPAGSRIDSYIRDVISAPTSSRNNIEPPTSQSDFQLLVEDTVGHPVPVYGRQLFEEVPSTFAPADRVPVPADYVLGPEDEVLIRVWGKIDLNTRVTVEL